MGQESRDSITNGGNDLRAAIVATARALCAAGLNAGTAGNVSARTTHGMLITPSGVTADALTLDSLAHVWPDGRAGGPLAPSSEWRFHADIYARHPRAGAIVHTHSPFATALACQRLEIPPFHYMVARFGGSTVRCARYATFGTQELSDHILAALDERSACLIANHGMVVYGRDPAHALAMAIEFETLCEHYWRTAQLGPPVLLSAQEMAEAIERFAGYGQAKPAGD
jgi:L-fuculose-phosphate aldolase